MASINCSIFSQYLKGQKGSSVTTSFIYINSSGIFHILTCLRTLLKLTAFCLGVSFWVKILVFSTLCFSPDFPLNKSRSIYFLWLVNMIYRLLEEKRRKKHWKNLWCIFCFSKWVTLCQILTILSFCEVLFFSNTRLQHWLSKGNLFCSKKAFTQFIFFYLKS